MTSYYMDRYFKNQTYYKIQSQSIVDNPDQRIVDDLKSFTGTSLYFSTTLVNAAVDLISFSNILYSIYAPLFIILVVYTLGGTAISLLLGKGLVNLNFMQERKEADFRYALVRIRENAESIAFYGGEGNEIKLLMERFRKAFENLSKLLVATRNLEFFTDGYRHMILVLPTAVVAPMYFSGKIELGVVTQATSAFSHILNAVSLIVHEFQAISAFSAVIDRLAEFDEVLDDNELDKSISGSQREITLLYSGIKNSSSTQSKELMRRGDYHKLLEIQNLTLQTPKTRNILIRDLSLEINVNDRLLVMGPSGSGKTSLLRALAGLWSTGKGNITFYMMDDENPLEVEDALKLGEECEGSENRGGRSAFFLPQRPYLVLGTLRQQLLYPTWSEDSSPSSDSLPFLSKALSSKDFRGTTKKPTVDELIKVLEMVRLGNILSRFNGLDSTYEWSSVLSLGEQQRLAFARLLLAKPQLVLLDESTSALDDTNEAHLYKQIEAAGMAYISIGHRKTLLNYHSRVLLLSETDVGDAGGLNWHLESINQMLEEE